ncbi:MAG: DNA translocase FtsK, partial [Sulfurimonas sp.]|nr:DNA translocase FtsK [Sulfurimonas sp.]
MKDTIFIIVFGVLIYLGFATILGDNGLMGSYGSTFAVYNHMYFGYISFIYLLASLIPLYFLYKNTKFNLRKLELSISIFLIFFSLLLAQSLIIENEFRGKFAGDFVDFLSPYIGVFGLWVFWFIITSVSIIIFLDKSTQEIASNIFEFIKSKLPEKKEKEIKKELVKEEISQQVQSLAENLKPEEVEEVQEIEEVKDIPFEIKIKKAEPIKDEETFDKQENLLDLVSKVKEQKNAVIVDELEENAKLLEGIEKGKVEKPKNFKLPSVDFLQKQDLKSHSIDESELDDKIRYLIEKLAHFKIDGDVVRTYAGPVVSTFEFKPAANVKVSKILNLQDDLAMALSAETIRIQAPIPGKDVVGIEIPNETVDTIYLRELLDSKLFKDSSSPLTIALGKDIVG